MNSLSKIERFRQVKSEIRKNKSYLLIGIDSSKRSSIACFYNIENGTLLKKYSISHNTEAFQEFTGKIRHTMNLHSLNNIIIGVEPTGNYHKPLCEYLKNRDYFVVYVSSVAAKNNRKTISAGRWGKNDPRDAYNIADLMSQGKILFYRDENNEASNIRKYLFLRQHLTKVQTAFKTRIQNNIWACHFPELYGIFKNTSDPDVLRLLEHCPSAEQIKNIDFTFFISIFPGADNPRSKRYIRLSKVWHTAKTSIGFPMPSATVLEAKLISRDVQRTQLDIHGIDKKLYEFCNHNDEYRSLLTLPGFGIFTIAVFKSIIGNINDFVHWRQIVKFAGLDIETMTSGNFTGKEKISKKGSSLLRYAICHATNVAVSKNKVIKQLFQNKLKERGNSKIAKAKLKIKFAEKFLRAAFVMLKNNEPFNINLFNVPVDDSALSSVRA